MYSDITSKDTEISVLKEMIRTYYQPEIERLNNIIDKVIEDLKSTKELNNKHILARDNIIVNLDIDHIDYLLDILKEKKEM